MDFSISTVISKTFFALQQLLSWSAAAMPVDVADSARLVGWSRPPFSGVTSGGRQGGFRNSGGWFEPTHLKNIRQNGSFRQGSGKKIEKKIETST